MEGPELVVALAALGVGAFFIHKLFDVIKSFMNRNKDNSNDITEELIRDYLAFKKQTEQRFSALEQKRSTAKPLLSPSDEDEQKAEVRSNLKNMLKS